MIHTTSENLPDIIHDLDVVLYRNSRGKYFDDFWWDLWNRNRELKIETKHRIYLSCVKIFQ